MDNSLIQLSKFGLSELPLSVINFNNRRFTVQWKPHLMFLNLRFSHI
jgi:hypothetical protein